MERSAMHLLAKRGKSQRQIAEELGRNRRTIARVLREPVERRPAKRYRRSKVDPYRAQIVAWLGAGLTAARMLELAREDPAQPYRGGDNVFRSMVRRIRLEQQQQHAATDVPIRFEGLPGEYLQVDWGEVRRFPFAQQPPATRYFLACRLKYSRWSWVCFTADMRQETLFRGLVDCLVALGWVPWVLVFDNMKTVTSGRDAVGEAVWTPGLLQLAGECGFHPQACDPGAPNQKGSVEALVKWVKGNFLPGRTFTDDAELAAQAADWLAYANTRPSAATGAPPQERLAAEAAQGGPLPATLRDYGLLIPGQVAPEALVAVHGNRYSVPVAHVGAPVAVRVHRARIRLWRDATCLADHPRAPDGAGRRVVDPAHFAPLFPHKPRARAMLVRERLLALGGVAPAFLAALSRQRRAHLREELLALDALHARHGTAELLAAMARADVAGAHSADALALLLAAPAAATPPAAPLHLPGVPPQEAVDRLLSAYEALVHIDVAPPGGGVMSDGLATLLEQVQLTQAATVLPAWLARAAHEELGYADFLQGLLEEELTARTAAATQRRLRDAAFPFAATIEQFDFRFRPDLKRQVVLRYLDPTFVAQAGTLTLIGPPGLGKTMLAICVATKQVQLGHTARFVTAQTLAAQLGRTGTVVGRQRLLKPLLTCDVLVLDELGYLPTEPAFGPALYEVIAGRYERRPTILTSNKSLTEWASIVQDVSLAAALVDRLMHHGQVFYLKGPSWRTRGQTVGQPPTPEAAG